MKASLFVLGLGLLASSPAFADSRCVSLAGTALRNACSDCAEVTLHELRPPKDQHAGLFSGVTRKVRLDGKKSEDLQTHGNWVIGTITACH
jgi:hypothetical protein